MISYTLKCKDDHSFDSWFKSADAFETLLAQGHVACPICGLTDVRKSLMAPAVSAKKSSDPSEKSLAKPGNAMEAALRELRKKVEENSEYVGKTFASEARAIHHGEAPDRPIYGEARLDEAKKLHEDGIPVAPLPFAPRAKVN